VWWCCRDGVWVDCRSLSVLVPGGDVAVYGHVVGYAHQLVGVEKRKMGRKGKRRGYGVFGDGKGKNEEDCVRGGVCERGNANFGKSGDDQSKRGGFGNLNLTPDTAFWP